MDLVEVVTDPPVPIPHPVEDLSVAAVARLTRHAAVLVLGVVPLTVSREAAAPTRAPAPHARQDEAEDRVVREPFQHAADLGPRPASVAVRDGKVDEGEVPDPGVDTDSLEARSARERESLWGGLRPTRGPGLRLQLRRLLRLHFRRRCRGSDCDCGLQSSATAAALPLPLTLPLPAALPAAFCGLQSSSTAAALPLQKNFRYPSAASVSLGVELSLGKRPPPPPPLQGSAVPPLAASRMEGSAARLGVAPSVAPARARNKPGSKLELVMAVVVCMLRMVMVTVGEAGDDGDDDDGDADDDDTVTTAMMVVIIVMAISW